MTDVAATGLPSRFSCPDLNCTANVPSQNLSYLMQLALVLGR